MLVFKNVFSIIKEFWIYYHYRVVPDSVYALFKNILLF